MPNLKPSIVPVIIAGGSGTRLWPLSRSKHPKQFISLTDKETMFQKTLKRLERLDTQQPTIICNKDHRFYVAEQLRQLNLDAKIILEPFSRNTAAAIELASLNHDRESLLLIMSADIVVNETEKFLDSIKKAVPLAQKGRLVTFGVEPTSPHTGYGYIKKGDSDGFGFNVREFKEKPSLNLAKQYLSNGSYLWNSGIFLFKAKDFSEELIKFRPDISHACKKSVDNIQEDFDFLRIDEKSFEKCPDESVDFAVMENTDKSCVVPLQSDWADAGSWTSLWEISPKDSNGNFLKGDVVTHQTKNSYIRSEDKLITTLGIEDLILISTKDAILVATKKEDQNLKLLLDKLKHESRTEIDLHREVYRPWGKYDSLGSSDYYQVKKITVKPGAKLSVQLHNHRAEHWVVISGEAKVTIDDNVFNLSENESTFIPAKTVHSLENATESNLEIIEVQTGTYFGEDDIIRLEDRYGRDNYDNQ